jgi:hypothetical protein
VPKSPSKLPPSPVERQKRGKRDQHMCKRDQQSSPVCLCVWCVCVYVPYVHNTYRGRTLTRNQNAGIRVLSFTHTGKGGHGTPEVSKETY